jgi:hypothetical protein
MYRRFGITHFVHLLTVRTPAAQQLDDTPGRSINLVRTFCEALRILRLPNEREGSLMCSCVAIIETECREFLMMMMMMMMMMMNARRPASFSDDNAPSKMF